MQHWLTTTLLQDGQTWEYWTEAIECHPADWLTQWIKRAGPRHRVTLLGAWQITAEQHAALRAAWSREDLAGPTDWGGLEQEQKA